VLYRHNGAALWRAMKTKGFTGNLRVVTEWATRKRKYEGTATSDMRPSKTPSARRIHGRSGGSLRQEPGPFQAKHLQLFTDVVHRPPLTC
jgi:hypothetical protein